MYNGHGKFMVQLPLSDFLKKMEAFVPSLCVNQMWTRKNDHAPQSERVDFFNTCPKEGRFEKNSSLTNLVSSLGLQLSSVLVNMSKMCLANIFTTILTKIKSNLIYACSM
jgi:hypothetical protein